MGLHITEIEDIQNIISLIETAYGDSIQSMECTYAHETPYQASQSSCGSSCTSYTTYTSTTIYLNFNIVFNKMVKFPRCIWLDSFKYDIHEDNTTLSVNFRFNCSSDNADRLEEDLRELYEKQFYEEMDKVLTENP